MGVGAHLLTEGPFRFVQPSESVVISSHSHEPADGHMTVALYFDPDEAERLADQLRKIAATARDLLRAEGWTQPEGPGTAWQRARVG